MSTSAPPPAEPTLEIDLRDPHVAALFAWLWPGAGHLYQRRYLKAVLFAVCILATYFFGLALGEGKVVYAAWNSADKRWQYPLQLGVGLPAAPALVQSLIVRRGGDPILGGLMRPPRPGELSQWHRDLNLRFELGTLYTMIAGLLNILAIWDAYGGPVIGEPGKERGPPDGDKSKDKDKDKPKTP
ncbi:MAG TPA: DUF6677 family protein [Pirellulaceae bacterium]|nr:DUF6677 family protein [Pirellulaceae bacterium]